MVADLYRKDVKEGKEKEGEREKDQEWQKR